MPRKDINKVSPRRNLFHLVKTVLVHFHGVHLNPKEIHNLVSYVFHLWDSKGSKFIIQYLKCIEEITVHLESEEINEMRPGLGIVGIDSRNRIKFVKRHSSLYDLPKFLQIKILMSLAAIRKLITCRNTTDLSSITDTMDPCCFESIKAEATRIYSISKGGKRLSSSKELPNFYWSTKKGPNGPALFSRPLDSYVLEESGLKDALIEYLHIFTGEDVDDIEDHFDDKYSYEVEPLQAPISGCISAIQEPGKLKPRIFAMVDSITQECLKGLHDVLMEVLRSIPEDCTFDQDKCAEVISRGHKYYGFSDLSSATDRLHRLLYESMLDSYIPGLGKSWTKVLDRDFTVTGSVSSLMVKRTESIRYSVGQPMGALSSWPAMALLHHHLVWVAAGSYNRAKGKYLILGDDIVIFDKKLYQSYLRILRNIGAPYKDSSSEVLCEFAKRFFYKNKEVTGIYFKSLASCRESPGQFALTWAHLSTRNHDVGTDFPSKIYRLIRNRRIPKDLIKHLFNFPTGVDSIAKIPNWISGLTGTNYCLHRDHQGAFRLLHQLATASLMSTIDQMFSRAKDLSNMFPKVAKHEVESYLENRVKSDKYLVDRCYQELVQNYQRLTFQMEKEWKLIYLTDSPDYIRLLRPSVPKWVYPLNVGRDKRKKQILTFASNHALRMCHLGTP